MPDNAPQPSTAFISYSKRDRDLCEELITHLSSLKREGLLKPWHDGELLPGSEAKKEIKERIHEADLLLLLLSASYFDSADCQVEEETAMQRWRDGQARVIPIRLRAHSTKLEVSELVALPDGDEPVAEWASLDAALTNVTEGVRRILKEQPPLKSAKATPSPPAKLVELTSPAPRKRIEDLRWAAVRTSGLIDALAASFPTPEQIKGLLEQAELPTGRLPVLTDQDLDTYWRSVCRRLDAGLVKGRLASLVCAAHDLEPGQELFEKLAHGDPL